MEVFGEGQVRDDAKKRDMELRAPVTNKLGWAEIQETKQDSQTKRDKIKEVRQIEMVLVYLDESYLLSLVPCTRGDEMEIVLEPRECHCDNQPREDNKTEVTKRGMMAVRAAKASNTIHGNQHQNRTNRDTAISYILHKNGLSGMARAGGRQCVRPTNQRRRGRLTTKSITILHNKHQQHKGSNNVLTLLANQGKGGEGKVKIAYAKVAQLQCNNPPSVQLWQESMVSPFAQNKTLVIVWLLSTFVVKSGMLGWGLQKMTYCMCLLLCKTDLMTNEGKV